MASVRKTGVYRSRGPAAVKVDFSEERLTANAGLAFVARQAQRLGLPAALHELQLKQRRRGVDEVDACLSLIYNLSAGNGSLSDLDRLRADEAACQATGLHCGLSSRRASEFLARFTASSLGLLHAIARRVARPVVAAHAQRLHGQLGYVPVFVDGSAIEVQGTQFEGARRGYNGSLQYWLHAVFVGDMWASSRLHPGGTDVASSWHEQLKDDLAAMLPQGVCPWVRADNAYYRGDFVRWLQGQRWDYSISVTNDNNKAPVLRQVRGDSGHHWRRLNDDEHATLVWHQPAGWDRPQAYVVVCTRYEGAQALIEERYQVIAVSRTDLSVAELVRRHRAKQGQENALKGPLVEMDLHHPPCKSLAANAAFYSLAQIAQVLLMALKYEALPQGAHSLGVGRLMRTVVRLAGKLTQSGRQLHLWLSKGTVRLDWLAHCANKLGFG